MIATFQYISSTDSVRAQEIQINKALEAGIQWIQLRMKNAHLDDIRLACNTTSRLCKTHDATFILNDYVPLVKEVQADGVHIGLQDFDQKEARDIIGPDKILGLSAHSLSDIVQIHTMGVADYIHLGPFRYTNYKAHAAPIIGVDGYWDIMRKCKQSNLNIPILALGGIALKDVRSIIETGVYGIAATELIQDNDRDLQDTLKRINWLLAK